LSFQDGKRNSDSIASKLIAAGFPADLDGLRFSAALNIWEFVPFGGGGGATLSNQRDEVTADETTTSGTFVNTTLVLTLANRAGGNFMASCALYNANSTVNLTNFFRYQDGATNLNGGAIQLAASGVRFAMSIFMAGNLDGDVVQVQFRNNGGTTTLYGTETDRISHLVILEIS